MEGEVGSTRNFRRVPASRRVSRWIDSGVSLPELQAPSAHRSETDESVSAASEKPDARSAKAAKNKNAAFYEGQFQTAKYFINSILPITMGRMNAIAAGDGATVEMPEASFGS